MVLVLRRFTKAASSRGGVFVGVLLLKELRSSSSNPRLTAARKGRDVLIIIGAALGLAAGDTSAEAARVRLEEDRLELFDDAEAETATGEVWGSLGSLRKGLKSQGVNLELNMLRVLVLGIRGFVEDADLVE